MARAVPTYILRLSLTGRFWEKIEAILEKWDSPLLQLNARGLKSA